MSTQVRYLAYNTFKSIGRKHSRFEHYNILRERQWDDYSRIKEAQDVKLRSLLEHAYKHVPYYRELLEGRVVSTGCGEIDLSGFAGIPLLNRSTLRDRFEQMKGVELDVLKAYENASGGSTGEPVRFVQHQGYFEWAQSVKLLFNSWSGHTFGARQVRLWGSERDLFAGKERLRTRAGRWFRNELWLNAFRMTPGQMATYVKKINDFKPVQILAYAGCAYELARFIEEEGLRVEPVGSIMTSAGTLHLHMRETIERVFGAPVFNRYGTREVGDIACECEHHQGLHVSPLTHLVEIVKEGGEKARDGEVGEVVVTSLENFAMPLIRYRIGDVASLVGEPCPCGRGWPMLNNVSGRVTDVFIRRDGGVVLPEYLIHLVGVVLNRGWIRKYQVVQEGIDDVVVTIAPLLKAEAEAGLYGEQVKELTQKIQLVMGENCSVRVSFVDDILPASSGKFSYTFSKVKR